MYNKVLAQPLLILHSYILTIILLYELMNWKLTKNEATSGNEPAWTETWSSFHSQFAEQICFSHSIVTYSSSTSDYSKQWALFHFIKDTRAAKYLPELKPVSTT